MSLLFIIMTKNDRGKPYTPDEDSLLGNIYIGRVENVVQNIRAVFVKISPEQTCYLSLDDLKNAILPKSSLQEKKLWRERNFWFRWNVKL